MGLEQYPLCALSIIYCFLNNLQANACIASLHQSIERNIPQEAFSKE